MTFSQPLPLPLPFLISRPMACSPSPFKSSPHDPPSQHPHHPRIYLYSPHPELLSTSLTQNEFINVPMQRQRFVDVHGVDVVRCLGEAVVGPFAKTLATIRLVGCAGGERGGTEGRAERAMGLKDEAHAGWRVWWCWWTWIGVILLEENI